jgi:general nucleoside transport system ATP-binding protein
MAFLAKSDQSSPKTVLQMRDIVVRFGSLVANDHIGLEVQNKEIHALLGENGAGKTTLMKVLVGLVKLQSGEIILDENKVEIRSPETAMRLGIGMVHQHFMLKWCTSISC